MLDLIKEVIAETVSGKNPVRYYCNINGGK